MIGAAWLLIKAVRRVKDRLDRWRDSWYMETEVVCQHCSKRLKRHCKHCLWLECEPCQMVIGDKVVYYGEALKRNEETLKRQNGI